MKEEATGTLKTLRVIPVPAYVRINSGGNPDRNKNIFLFIFTSGSQILICLLAIRSGMTFRVFN
mgnify:CR=1 FL=1